MMRHKWVSIIFLLFSLFCLNACSLNNQNNNFIEVDLEEIQEDQKDQYQVLLTPTIDEEKVEEYSPKDSILISVNEVGEIPDDLSNHIKYAGSGGGGAIPCLDIEEFRNNLEENITEYAIPNLTGSWCFCSLMKPENELFATITNPNGEKMVITGDVSAGCMPSESHIDYNSNAFSIDFDYNFEPDFIPGIYTFEFTFDENYYQEKFYPLKNTFQLVNLDPNEYTRIIVFNSIYTSTPAVNELLFIHEIYTYADKNGVIKISFEENIQDKSIKILYFGEFSGFWRTSQNFHHLGHPKVLQYYENNLPFGESLKIEDIAFTKLPENQKESQYWNPCENTYESRLNIEDFAYVSYDPLLANNVRNQPGLNTNIIGKIQPGEEIKIIKGPKCVNHMVWWKIESLETGLKGWTSEGDEENYWLIPND